jgi:ribosome-associated toxin RatA of RatAB toxin-antitoxin module
MCPTWRATTWLAGARRPFLSVCAWLACGGAAAPEWTLADEDLARLDQREVLLPAVSERSGGSIRAAIEIDAPAERIFRTMTDCARALQFVPHLVGCTVLESAPDGSWQTIRHDVSYGRFLPRTSYVFRADYRPFERVRFSGVRGPWQQSEGVWELQPRGDGAATILIYRAQFTPRTYLLGRIALAGLKRDLPALLQRLRALCEAP